MPEATTLYSVTGVVLAGLVAWVVVVLNKAKEPWSRPAPPEEPADELDTPESKKDDVVGDPTETKTEEPVSTETPKLSADDTARATPVALSEGRQKVASEPAAEEKTADAEEKKADA